VLTGVTGPARDIVILNAAAGLIAAGIADDPLAAATLATDAIDNGSARTLLARLAERSNRAT
jgi:anthranilate phosphoribosyltransferase